MYTISALSVYALLHCAILYNVKLIDYFLLAATLKTSNDCLCLCLHTKPATKQHTTTHQFSNWMPSSLKCHVFADTVLCVTREIRIRTRPNIRCTIVQLPRILNFFSMCLCLGNNNYFFWRYGHWTVDSWNIQHMNTVFFVI